MSEIQPISTEGMPSEIVDGAATEQMESLEAIMTEQPAEAATDEAPAKEPGWIKGRIDKAVSKAEARIRQEYEAKLAPLYESIYDRQAEELVSAGEFKSLETAKEYVRMKNGIAPTEAPQPQTKTEPVRDDKGRFAPQEQKTDPVAQAQADLLFKQAQKIKTTRGVDVMSVFNSDETVRNRVLAGEWDFYDVADAAMSGKESSHPSIVRSANGGAPSGFDISRMSDEQFKRLQQNLREGHRYDLTK